MSESPIFEGILSDARLKSEKVIEKAHKEAGDILKEAEDKAEKTREEERKNTKMRLDALSLKEESAVRSLERLRELKNNDAAYNAVQKEVDAYFDSYFLKDESRSTLIAWIAEAAYGLGYRQAKVAYSPKEKVDESMLRQAEKLLMEKTGFQVTLQLDDAPVSGWGVQLSSLDGKVYFNNQLDVRLRRMAKDIKKIIQENTCKAE